MSVNQPSPRRISPFKITFLLVSCSLLCALLWLAWAVRPLNVAREFGIETTIPETVPSPNAAELYIAANQKFNELRLPGKPVARILDLQSPTTVEDTQQNYPLNNKVRWLEQNKAAFTLFDQAMATPFYSAPVRVEKIPDDAFHPATLRHLARYDSVRCDVLKEQGQYQQAVDKSLRLWKAGLSVQTNTAIVPTLGGVAIESMARKALDPNLAHLTAPQAAEAAKKLETLVSMRPTLKTILQEEHDSHLYKIRPELERTIQYNIIAEKRTEAYERGEYDSYFFEKPEDQRSWSLWAPVLNWGARKMANEFHYGMQPLINQADSPWSQRQFELPKGLSSEVANLITALDKGRFFHTKAETAQQMTLARLALHAYRKTKGVYPTTLNELAPTYLKKVPTDAFADGKALNYRREGQNYKLWSVGPDGCNDNAKPGINARAVPKSQLLISAESQGDIVANINRY